MHSYIGSSKAVGASNRLREDVSPFSGLCVVCVEDCVGLCEVGRSAIRGPEIIYPQPFGDLTAAAQKDYPVHWGHFTILGTASGAHGIEPDSDKATFQNVNIETVLGKNNGKPGLKLRSPYTIPGLGSTDVARKNWGGLAAGTALYGVLMTVGENVVGMDDNAEIRDGKVIESPELRRRIDAYRRWQREGHGGIVVQENVEDNRLGVLEYALRELNVDGVEIKWGQGAKDIGGEVKISDLEKAQMLYKRGYIIIPDPTDPDVINAFNRKVFREFERHSRLGMVTEEGFARRVEELRKAGAKYIFLKTGAYRPADLARAIAFSSKYGVDVLTIDAAGGGTGMSPWRMMNEWGIPQIELATLMYNYASLVAGKGKHLPDIVLAGGYTLEDHIFKGLALGAPFVKAIGMARAPLTAAMVGRAIERRIEDHTLPPNIKEHGPTREEIFIASTHLNGRLGRTEFKEIPTAALGVYGYCMRVDQGLKQLMAGARKFNLSDDNARPDRNDIAALTEEAARRSGIQFVMDVDEEKAMQIVNDALK